nr:MULTISPECIES: hypothetical protein [unclassified Burkholderia]
MVAPATKSHRAPSGASNASGASSTSGTSGTSSASSASSASEASGASASLQASSAQSATPRVLTAPPLPTLTEAEAADVTRRALALRATFAHEVTRRLNVPAAEQRAYGERLQQMLDTRNLGELAREYVVLVDRAPNVQAAFIYFRTTRNNTWEMIGASPVATGLPGQYDHFVTPLGVFEHTPANMDFRAEGTMNDNGIRGYGRHDMRIYDFGWADAERGWGKGGVSQMRFQMHATDPEYLEPLLGIRHSKGCVRIPATLNVFIDQHGILDAEYEARAATGDTPWVLRAHRQVTPWAGRFLVVVDSARKTRPAWSPAPGKKAQAKVPKGGDTAD